ncbi:MAG TPA: translocation/assembly module TamB domain-containing protein [Gemmatimonadaceae bacterium]|nr:translocation/assembly module TamB domain-containing protein [Gemmatimonadaceae bacterium]
MPRRRKVVLSSAVVLIALMLIVVLLVVGSTQTRFGQERVRGFVQSWLAAKVNGKMYVGRISGGLLNGVVIDSIEIRDENDSLFLATGRVFVKYELRDLLDKRVLVRLMTVEHPNVHLRYYPDGKWNFERIFPRGQPAPLGRRRGFGEFVQMDSAFVRDAKFAVTIPWRVLGNPPKRVRDSIVTAALTDPAREVRRAGSGYTRTWRWERGNAALGPSRLADPDSSARVFTVRDLSVKGLDPPFYFTNVNGTVRQVADSVWAVAPHFDLPASTGSAKIKVVCCGGLPLRYYVDVTGDSVSMSDVAWVYPTLPRTGGGRMKLAIRNSPDDLEVLDYRIYDMDVRSTRSRLLGEMTFGIGRPLLVAKNVRLEAAPIDFDLIRTLAGGPFTYDWQGKITGTVAASGGPLDRFRVERADVVFADANVPGAVARGTGRGMLDITLPALAVFRGFDVNVARFDLRTARFLNPEFPKLQGWISGTARLDSIWTDLRFSSADALHHDGPGRPSRVTGSGRVTLGDEYVSYDVDLLGAPLSLTTLARSYPAIPLRGDMTGPIRVRGNAADMSLVTTLANEHGSISFDGKVDAEAPSYVVKGSGAVARVDARGLLASPELPATSLNGSYEVDLVGSSAEDLRGTVRVTGAASRIDEVAILRAMARVAIADGIARVDTMEVVSAAGVATGTGTIGLAKGASGALDFVLAVDSLAALSAYLGEGSKSGAVTVRGRATTDATGIAVRGTVSGAGVAAGERRAGRVSGTFDGRRQNGSTSGSAAFRADTVAFGRIRLASVDVTADQGSSGSGTARATLIAANGASTRLAARTERRGDTLLVALDTASIAADSVHQYRLASPAMITLAREYVDIDSMRFELFARERSAVDQSEGALLVRDIRVANDSVRGSVVSSGIDLSVIQTLLPVTDARGALGIDLHASGPVKQPVLNGSLRVADGRFTIPATGVAYERFNSEIELVQDTLYIRRLTLYTPRGGGRNGGAAVLGNIDLSTYTRPRFDVRVHADHFRALRRPGVATLDVSTGPEMRLLGDYDAAVLRGGLVVNEGTVFLPELLGKDIIDLDDPALSGLVDSTLRQARRFLPKVPSAFASNLTLDNVSVTVGDDVWLRSSEANIKLGGRLDLVRGRTQSAVTGASVATPQLALAGTLNAERGTYVLNLGVVQPTFEVERGTLRFFGGPEVNPSLDIRAIHTVRRPRQSFNREDVRVLVAITGTLGEPALSLASADSLPLSQSDLLSYLVTGEPAFALSNSSAQYTEQLLTIGGRLAGTFISSRIPRSVFDIVEVQTGTIGGEGAAGGSTSSYLSSLFTTRVILGKQLSERWFLGLSTGLCRQNFAENLGLRLEYRISSTLSAEGGIEPGSGELACAGTTAARGFQQTPPQLGVDIFRSWRF